MRQHTQLYSPGRLCSNDLFRSEQIYAKALSLEVFSSFSQAKEVCVSLIHLPENGK